MSVDWIEQGSLHLPFIQQYGRAAFAGAPLSIAHDLAPCCLHLDHSPITVINELHHIRPQYLQHAVWGSVRDTTRVPICATGHNSVHSALGFVLAGRPIPRWCVGRTRDLVEWTAAWWADVNATAEPPDRV